MLDKKYEPINENKKSTFKSEYSYLYRNDKTNGKKLQNYSLKYHNYKKQDINYKLCGSWYLYFFYLFERMNFYDTILKLVFE